MKTPKFSILVPTRNRPWIIGHTLRFLKNQTFTDFEVIVSDNHTGQPCANEFAEFKDDPRFKYVTPPTPLSMSDNWNFAASFSRGDYLLLTEDKVVIRPHALEILDQFFKKNPVDLVSWPYVHTTPESLQDTDGKCTFHPTNMMFRQPFEYDPQIELKRRFSFDIPRDAVLPNKFWAKLCLSAYSRSLVNRMIAQYGKLTFPMAPDYTSMISALSLANGAFDLGTPLMIFNSGNSKVSTGGTFYRDPEFAFRFFRDSDPSLKLIDELPISGFFVSTHNLVGGDFTRVQRAARGLLNHLTIDQKNFLRRCQEDLLRIEWKDPGIRSEQLGLFKRALSQLGPMESFAVQRLLPEGKGEFFQFVYWLSAKTHTLPLLRKINSIRKPAFQNSPPKAKTLAPVSFASFPEAIVGIDQLFNAGMNLAR